MTTNSGTRPRRARSAAGSVPPRVGLNITQVIHAARVVEAALDGVALGEILDAALSRMAPAPDGSWEDAVVSSLTNVVRHSLGFAEARGVREAIRTAFREAQDVGSLDETIASFVAEGVDAERVAWQVISVESLRHEGLIHRECNKLTRMFPEWNPNDFIGYGWAGLRVALRNYDPSMGFAFSTYACPKINGAIRDGLRAENPLPKRLTTFVRKVSAVEEKLTHDLLRAPTYSEISSYVESYGSMALLPRLTTAASIEEMTWSANSERARELPFLTHGADPSDLAVGTVRDEALHAALAGLPADEQEAVRRLVLEEEPAVRVAAELGVDPRVLRARKTRGLELLREAMASWARDALLVTQ